MPLSYYNVNDNHLTIILLSLYWLWNDDSPRLLFWDAYKLSVASIGYPRYPRPHTSSYTPPPPRDRTQVLRSEGCNARFSPPLRLPPTLDLTYREYQYGGSEHSALFLTYCSPLACHADVQNRWLCPALATPRLIAFRVRALWAYNPQELGTPAGLSLNG
jgi:hypothetical protein